MLGSPIQKEKGQAEKENLFGEAAGKAHPSANISEPTNKTGSFEPVKPSVREELREITVAQKQKEGTLKAEEKVRFTEQIVPTNYYTQAAKT